MDSVQIQTPQRAPKLFSRRRAREGTGAASPPGWVQVAWGSPGTSLSESTFLSHPVQLQQETKKQLRIQFVHPPTPHSHFNSKADNSDMLPPGLLARKGQLKYNFMFHSLILHIEPRESNLSETLTLSSLSTSQ